MGLMEAMRKRERFIYHSDFFVFFQGWSTILQDTGGGNFDLKSISHADTNFAFWRAQKEFFSNKKFVSQKFLEYG